MNDKARWETPELERIGHAEGVQSGDVTGPVEAFGSNPSGPA